MLRSGTEGILTLILLSLIFFLILYLVIAYAARNSREPFTSGGDTWPDISWKTTSKSSAPSTPEEIIKKMEHEAQQLETIKQMLVSETEQQLVDQAQRGIQNTKQQLVENVGQNIREDARQIMQQRAQQELDQIEQLKNQIQMPPVGETGRITLENARGDGFVASLRFRHEYINPVVIPYIATRNGGQPYEVRASDVTSRGCQILGREPRNYDRWHATETVCYLVVERGVHTLPSGAVLEAGSLDTSAVYFAHRGNKTSAPERVQLRHTFSRPPAVLHALNTHNNDDFMSTSVTDVTSNSFRVRQMAAETSAASASETIAWVAVSPGAFGAFEAGRRDSGRNMGVEDAPLRITYTQSYDSKPDVIAKGNTENGSNGYWTRGAGRWDARAADVYAAEDTSRDSDRSHTNETIAWFVAKPNSTLRPRP